MFLHQGDIPLVIDDANVPTASRAVTLTRMWRAKSLRACNPGDMRLSPGYPPSRRETLQVLLRNLKCTGYRFFNSPSHELFLMYAGLKADGGGMRYYLSYVESGRHASLMLSMQKKEGDPVDIVYEGGFDIEGGTLPLVGQGYFVREAASSKALYSSIPVRHRTYEISASESEQFFKIMNDHRTMRQSETTQEEIDQQMFKGDRFRLLTKNCKVYALSIFEELGVYDAKKLSTSPLVQITRTKKSLMNTVSSEVISCPIKDKFIEDFKNLSKKMNDNIAEINNDELSPELKEDLEKLKELLDASDNKARKLFIEKNALNDFKSISYIAKMARNSLASEKEKMNNAKFEPLIESTEELIRNLDEMQNLNDTNNLLFVWTHPPKTAKRINLDNFDKEEKAIYTINVIADKLTDGLDDLESMVNNSLKKNLNDATSSELNYYSECIKEVQNDLQISTHKLNDALKNADQDVRYKAYLTRENDLKTLVDSLDEKISLYQQSHSDHKNSRVLNTVRQFFKNIIYKLRSKPKNLEHNPKRVLVESISSQRKNFVWAYKTQSEVKTNKKKKVKNKKRFGSKKDNKNSR